MGSIGGGTISSTDEWSPPGRSDGARLLQEATVGAELAPGGALVVFGLVDPEDPRRELALLVRLHAESPDAAPPGNPDPDAPEGAQGLFRKTALIGNGDFEGHKRGRLYHTSLTW